MNNNNVSQSVVRDLFDVRTEAKYQENIATSLNHWKGVQNLSDYTGKVPRRSTRLIDIDLRKFSERNCSRPNSK